MTYGSPASVEREDIRTYLARVRGGREADPELVDEFTRRYQVIGGSPLIGITRDQASALAACLGCAPRRARSLGRSTAQDKPGDADDGNGGRFRR